MVNLTRTSWSHHILRRQRCHLCESLRSHPSTHASSLELPSKSPFLHADYLVILCNSWRLVAAHVLTTHYRCGRWESTISSSLLHSTHTGSVDSSPHPILLISSLTFHIPWGLHSKFHALFCCTTHTKSISHSPFLNVSSVCFHHILLNQSYLTLQLDYQWFVLFINFDLKEKW